MARIAHFAVAICLALIPPWPVFAQTGMPGIGQRPALPDVGKLPEDWHPGEFDRATGKWLKQTSCNIKWVAKLGSQSFGSPVVADGRVFVGTNNNGLGHIRRYPAQIDLSCLLCFRESNGKLLWQYSSEKLPTGRIHDLSFQGMQSSPYIEGDRAWFVSNRGEVICLDTQGFADGDDDGVPYEESSVLAFKKDELPDVTSALDRQEQVDAIEHFIDKHWQLELSDCSTKVIRTGHQWRISCEVKSARQSFLITRDFWGLRITRENTQPGGLEADVVWRLDLMEQFGSQPHENSLGCVTIWKDTLFVCTGNGVDVTDSNIPAPEAPSFVALDKTTGKVLWTSNLPGKNIHHGSWSSPAVGMLGGVPQVIFNGGDGWTYSFHAEQWHAGKPQLLWKFDTNSKHAHWEIWGRGTRNEPIGVPVLHNDRVYLTTGQHAEYGEGPGTIWCIDSTKRGDVSAELVVQADDHQKVVPYDRFHTVRPDRRETVIPNPNSAVIWKYTGVEQPATDESEYHKQMHRSISPVVIAWDLLFASDFAGILHCLDSKSGKAYWSYDAYAAIWAPPLVADGKVYLADEDGDLSIFAATAKPPGFRDKNHEKSGPALIKPLHEIHMTNSIYTQPCASQGVLFIATKTHLFAIQEISE